MIDKGQIKFGYAQKWVDQAIEDMQNGLPEGRGDFSEGAFEAWDFDDLHELFSPNSPLRYYNTTLSLHYPEAYHPYYKYLNYLNHYPYAYFRRNDVMQLPVCCFSGIHEGHIKQVGNQFTAVVPPKYFHDFYRVETEEEFDALNYEDKPAVVIINDFNSFLDKLKYKLKEFKISGDQVLNKYVKYNVKLNDTFYTDIQPPKELFLKRPRFNHQSELRIVINTRDKEAIDFLYKNPIEIGSLTGIAKKTIGYFKEGIEAIFNTN